MTREGGWNNHRAYPLILSVQVEQEVQRYRLDKNLSMGKALNQLVHAGLVTLGYLPDPSKCIHEYRWVKQTGDKFSTAKCVLCGRIPEPGETILEDPDASARKKPIFGASLSINKPTTRMRN